MNNLVFNSRSKLLSKLFNVEQNVCILAAEVRLKSVSSPHYPHLRELSATKESQRTKSDDLSRTEKLLSRVSLIVTKDRLQLAVELVTAFFARFAPPNYSTQLSCNVHQVVQVCKLSQLMVAVQGYSF